MARSCRIRLLGGFAVEIDGSRVDVASWRHRRGADLVKFLALSPRHRVHRDQVTVALWPDLTTEAAAANLRKAIHYARRALGADGAIRVENEIVELWPDVELVVDVDEFERRADEALKADDRDAALALTETFDRDLLPEDRFATWTEVPRRMALGRFMDLLRAAGSWDTVVRLDPLDEAAHRELMRAHVRNDNRAAAMRQFEELRRALAEELGVGPDRETVALYEEILALEGTEPATPLERARAHLATGLLALNRMDLRGAERAGKVARDIAIDARLGRELGEASGLLGMAAHAQGRWRNYFSDEFEAIVREIPDLAEFVFDAHLCLSEFSLYGPEEPREVMNFARNLLDVAERYGSIQAQAVGTLMLGEAQLLAGLLDDAESTLLSSTNLHERSGATSGRALALQRLGEVALEAGKAARVAELLAEARTLSLESPLQSHLLVRIHGTAVLAAASPAEAESVLEGAEADLHGRDVCDPCTMAYRVAAAVTCARRGRLDDATGWLAKAESVAAMWQGGSWKAAVWEARGELRAAEGRPDQAAALFHEAAALFKGAGHVVAERRCRQRAALLESAAST